MKEKPKEGVIMAKKHSCEKYDLMMDDYIDGFLSDKDRKKLEEHLSTCEECRRSLRFSIALRNMIHSSAEIPAEALHGRVMESVKKEQKGISRKKLIRLGAIAAAFALICLSSAVAFAMLPGNRKPTDLPEDDPITEETLSAITPSVDNAFSAEKDEAENYMKPEALPTTDFAPEHPADDTFTVAEKVDSEASPELPDMVVPETIGPAAATEALTDAAQPAPQTEALTKPTDAATLQHAQTAEERNEDVIPEPESTASGRPGGEEITLALLIVSGLLAVASFIAFLISLSSVRRSPSNKDQ